MERVRVRGAVGPVLPLFVVIAVVLTLLALAAGRPLLDRLDVGTTRAQPYLDGFFAPEANPGLTYAFSSAQSTVRLPGFGAAGTLLTFRVSGDRAAGLVPPPLTLTVSDASVITVPLRPSLARYALLVPPSAGNLTVAFSSPTFVPSAVDNRALGVAFDWLEAQQVGWGRAWPILLAQLVFAAAAFALARQLDLPPYAAVAAALALATTSVVLQVAAPLLWAAHLPRLAVLVTVLALLLEPLRRGCRRLAQAGGVSFSADHERWLWRIVMLAALVKLGGVLSPQIIVYDERWHVPRTEWLLDGRVLDLILPSRVTLLGSTVGLEGGHFPYSPLWYFLIAPFGLLGAPLGIASNVLNVSLDVSRSLLLAFLAVRLSGNQRFGVYAALFYQLLPLPYWLISWGNWPTQLGLWGALVLTCVFSALDPMRLSRRQWLGLAAAAALAMACYTVVGVLAFLFIGSATLIGLWLRRYSPQFVRQVLLALIAGELLIFAVYHVWFVPTIVQDTVPVLIENIHQRFQPVAALEPVTAVEDVERLPLPTPAIDGSFLLNHLSWAGIALILGGTVLLWRRTPAVRPLIGGWLAIVSVFTAISWLAVDMILKQYFFLLPLAALSGGAVFAEFHQRSRLTRVLLVLAVIALAVVVAVRWYDLIMFKRHILSN